MDLSSLTVPGCESLQSGEARFLYSLAESFARGRSHCTYCTGGAALCPFLLECLGLMLGFHFLNTFGFVHI